MKLSVLDQAPITKGNTAPDALIKAVELAILAEELGYERIWMAEHHNTKGFASSAPEITAAYIAAKTSRIRVGTGGTMIMHYSPYKIAEVFKTLSALAPGRIDFGAGRAPGGDNLSIFALSEGRQPDVNNLYGKLEAALQLINDEAPQIPYYNRVIASPSNIVLPQSWLLGSSGNSAIQAGRMGLGYSYAQFFNGNMNKRVFDAYRENFVPSAFMEKSEIIVSYFVTVADTREEAEYEGKPADIARLLFMRGQIDQPRLTPEEAKDYPLTEMDRMWIEESRNQHFVGSAKEVAERLLAEQETYGFDEAMICTIPHSQEVRLNVYRLLAKELM
ncbi:LLM class flavin-dependent oxidoreductase [Lysinibacillus telephonicus]|uniref:LLM class flavin-dependent oxidoreductase n=1 Tax=Lysinibacillus telephonicus TaxID=1714840 RepID=A0A3S0JP31_9BACI|nr:LLM class flavin-dependent oxidoreductase [Lysinibacillus telephonicus]RTQ92479.1 LLM class flavin-dependent oxidoreductase [Lysinibacillus telephonicus]